MLDKPAAQTAANDDIGEDTRLKLFETQVVIREAEQRAYDLFLQNLVKGTSHLSLGQEAVAAGFAVAMKKGDLSFCTYRGHAHTLARGVPVEKVLGELMQRDNGLMRGKGGSMHLMSTEHGVMGSYAIIGAHLPIACGAAWRAQYKGHDDVSVCFFGDGTTNIGAFHEALNFAAVWKLPVVFVCENNLYMEYTPIADVTAVPSPAGDRAEFTAEGAGWLIACAPGDPMDPESGDTASPLTLLIDRASPRSRSSTSVLHASTNLPPAGCGQWIRYRST